MKKSVVKKLRKIADALPKEFYSCPVVSGVSGSELIKKGITKLSDGSSVSHIRDYKQKKFVKKEVNHLKKLKAMYLNYGESGIEMYTDKFKKAA